MIRSCLFLLLVAACGGGITTRDPPAPPASGLRVRLSPDAEDQGAAEALGWNSIIPNAEVVLAPQDSSAPPRTVASSAAGLADFGTLVAGRYTVSVHRWLTTAERARLPAAHADVNGWVARHLVTVTAQGSDQTVSVPASRGHGLVISEWAFNDAAFRETVFGYPFGGFLELYNNADTTVYLDGLTVVNVTTDPYNWSTWDCQSWSVFTDDRQGIWTNQVQQFPGSGRDHPVAPGRTVVIAVDAIDHSKIIPPGLDLSHADFEFWGGPGDVDNPMVPNMVDTLTLFPNLLGHGPTFGGLVSVVALTRAFDKAATRRVIAGPDTHEYLQIPADRVLDVVSLFPNHKAAWPRCPQLVSPRFDRASSDVRRYDDENVEYEYSVSRRALPPASAGRVVLQHSRNSDADFVRTRRSPGAVP